MIDAQFLHAIGDAVTAAGTPVTDRTAERLLDAAVLEAAAVGLRRLTIEDVVRRAGVSRMTAYRRYPRRDDLVHALVSRETQRFLGAVADAIEASPDPRQGVAEAFIAAVTFTREHPMLRRAAHLDPMPVPEAADLIDMGKTFIANYIQGGSPSQQARWVADVFARLFFTYISMPPADPDVRDDAALRRFAEQVLTPMVDRAVT